MYKRIRRICGSDNVARPSCSAMVGTQQPHRYRLFLFDCETTGLDPRQERILEIAILRYEPFQSPESLVPYSSLVKCERTVTINAFRAHGLTSACTRYSPTFGEIWAGVLRYIAYWTEEGERPLLVCHNIRFDVNFMRRELVRHGIVYPEWDVVCSLEIARSLWAGEDVRLITLAKKAVCMKHLLRARIALGGMCGC